MDDGRSDPYFPAADDWVQRDPAAVGIDRGGLAEAIAFAEAHETTSQPRDLARYFADKSAALPDEELIGPIKPRGAPNGVVLRHGYLVAEWGETTRVDMTFSVSKSFIATLAGLALDRGLIRDIDDRVAPYVEDDGFDSPQNAPITWHHLLQQTSEWEGTLWGKADATDRRRGRDRALRPPGTFFEYNDVRVNRLALSLLWVWRRPLPDVLKDEILDPLGASAGWEWHGYDTSWLTVDGRRVQSVSGGGHWGGGLWIDSRDLARFGHLMLRRGRWGDRRLLSERWIDLATSPCPVKPSYGYLWWLNTDRKLFPSAPERSYFALGGDLNLVWIDPTHDLVVVARWIERARCDEFMRRVLAALGPRH